jgi:predicted transcriptional regulator
MLSHRWWTATSAWHMVGEGVFMGLNGYRLIPDDRNQAVDLFLGIATTYDFGVTIRNMQVVTFRPDDEAKRALNVLTGGGRRPRSAVIRDALLLAYREQRREQQRAEAEQLAKDPVDRAEMQAIQEEMESLRAW